MDYDRFLPDEYSRRLGNINKTNQVLANQDIHNDSGLLIISKNSEVSTDIVNKIMKHRLASPLEEQVSLAISLTPEQLYASLRGYISSNNEYQQLHSEFSAEHELQSMCKLYANHTLLIQKLTIFQTELPNYFKKALFCAWMALLISGRMGLSSIEKKQLFIAALFQDIGLLHISEEIIENNSRTTKDQKIFDSHAIIGKTFLSAIPHIPNGVAKIILEHHDCPEQDNNKKTHNTLSQVIIICNQLYQMANEEYQEQLSLRGLIPILQVKSALYFDQVFSTTILLFKQSSNTEPQIFKNEQEFMEVLSKILINHTMLASLYKAVGALIKDLDSHFSPPVSLHLKNIGRAIHKTVTSTGILSEGLSRWVSHIEESGQSIHTQGAAGQEIQEIFLLQKIVQDQFTHFRNSLQHCLSYTDYSLSDTQQQKLTSCYESMTQISRHIDGNSLETEKYEFNLHKMCI